MCKMTENMQADVALSRKAVFVRCCLKSGKSESDRAQNETECAVVPILTASVVGSITVEKNGLHITLPENISAEMLMAVVDRLC